MNRLRHARLRWAFALGLGLLLSGCGQPYSYHGMELVPPQAKEITLTDQNGQPFALSSLRGKVVLLFFGFTSCPDVCPTTLADFRQVREKLGQDAQHTQVVLVTVDPERDTPAKLKDYLARYDSSYIGLTGTPAELAPVYKTYGVTAIRRELPDSALKYTIDHSASIYIIDQKGQWRLLEPQDGTLEDLTSDVQHLVQTGGAS